MGFPLNLEQQNEKEQYIRIAQGATGSDSSSIEYLIAELKIINIKEGL
jgi:hypothetical protein